MHLKFLHAIPSWNMTEKEETKNCSKRNVHNFFIDVPKIRLNLIAECKIHKQHLHCKMRTHLKLCASPESTPTIDRPYFSQASESLKKRRNSLGRPSPKNERVEVRIRGGRHVSRKGEPFRRNNQRKIVIEAIRGLDSAKSRPILVSRRLAPLPLGIPSVEKRWEPWVAMGSSTSYLWVIPREIGQILE